MFRQEAVMADASPTPATPSHAWRADGPALPGKSRRKTLLRVLLGLVAVTGVGIGVLLWMSPPATPTVLPIATTTNPDGSPAAWLEQDRAVLAGGELLGKPLDDWAANPNRDQIRLRFRALAKAPRSHPVVVYLAAPASVDDAGGVFLRPADNLGDHPRNRLTLAELLAAFKECPARHRLLILNLTPPSEDPLFAQPSTALSTAVFKTLEANDDPGRLCFVSCSAGQVPFASPELGRTAFGFYLEAGLHGAADAWTGETPDARVTVTELAAFLHSKVNDWSMATHGTAQTPVLVGSAADFTLHAITRSEEPGEPEVGTLDFPDWLRTGWMRSEQARRSPWAFRNARSALLAAERDLLAGKPAADVQRDLEARLATAEQLAAALTAAPTPDPLPTLAAMFPGYALPDPAILNDLRAAARQLDSRPPPAPAAAGEKPAPEPPIPPEFEPFKAKPAAVVAAAAFLILAEDSAPTATRVKGLNQLLAAQNLAPKFAETVLIRRLAELAATPGFLWSPERAALALQTARNFEDAAARPDVHTYAEPALDAAYVLRADAEAVLFAPGFAPQEEATRRLGFAEAAARKMKEAADQLRAATTTWELAAETLAGATPLVNAGTLDIAAGERLAAATRRLGVLLAPAADSLNVDSFTAKAGEWEGEAAAVRAAIADFTRPLQATAIVKLRARAEAADAGPAVVTELDALLATPLLAVADRADLWNLRAAISRRLATDALRKDLADREAIRRELASPPTVNPREPGTALTADAEAARRQARWSLALVRAGGGLDLAIVVLTEELSKLAANPVNQADRLRRLWTEELPLRAAKIKPPPVCFTRLLPVSPAAAYLDQVAKNPDAALVAAATRRVWMWQAHRFEYEAHEAVATDSGYAFATAAARTCASAAGTGPGSSLELSATAIPKLTPERPKSELKLNLRLTGDIEPPVRIRALSPAKDWVKIGGPTEVSPEPLREMSLGLSVAAGDSPVSFPEARGVLIEAEAGGRTYHRRAAVSLDDISNLLQLFVRTSPAQTPTMAREIRIRPDSTAHSYQFLLANPTLRDRKVIVRLAGLNREAEVTVPAKKSVQLAFVAPPMAAPIAPPVPPTAGQAPPPDLGIPVPGDEVKLELLNPADREEVLQTFHVPVSVANPADYLRVTDPVFLPAAGARKNRLSISVVPGEIPSGGPCTVRLGFPFDRNPELIVRDGNLTGPVSRGGGPLTLYAEHLALPGPGPAEVWVTVSADGMERVLTYTASLPSLGETVRLTPVGKPMVRVKVVPFAKGTTPLPVTLEVDNPSPGATLELLIGTAQDDHSPVVADLTMPIASAKDIAAWLKFDPKGETFLFTGSIKDHEPKLPLELLVGKRVLEARLLDRNGKELASDRGHVIFDGTPPRNVHFIDPLPPRVRKDQPLALRATCDPTISGIKEVKFFVGKPQGEALPANAVPVAGKLFDEKANEWRGSIPLEGLKGTVTVGVQFTTNAGLSKIETQDVELVDAAELNKPEPGAIAGKLMEGKLPQPDAVVILADEKYVQKAKTTTKADGTFAFQDLPPGMYFLFSQKISTGREVKQEVVVKPGETTAATLELYLK
jgi:hypothetical protein